ncbi:hypothetical protein R1sor_025330 [Riccia sorocarpa]|uniref:Uncharacterized protein n=1 Tax=Riccia sorocarpa TaxID=122646 RepID=A0ABD3GB31_9MARC
MADEGIATQTVSQSTPRRRAKDLAEGPFGPDDLVTFGNVHRLVTNDMIYIVFPERVGQDSRLFRAVASRSRIRMMRDCTSAAMVDAVREGLPVHYPDQFRWHGTPARGLSFEFSVGFVTLLYARAVLGRRVDFSRSSGIDPAPEIPLSQSTQTQIPQTPRRMRQRVILPGEIDFGADPATSYGPIVPHDEGPSSTPSTSRGPSPVPSTSSHIGWLPHTDREAVWNWIERAPFVLVDRQHHEAALRRLAESDGVEARLKREFESRFRTRLAEADEGTKQAEEALRLANLAVAELTSSAATLDGRIQDLRAELLQKEERIGDLLLVNNGQRTNIAALREELDGERVERDALIAELDLARGVAAVIDGEHIVDNGLQVNAPPAHPEGPVQPEVDPEVQAEAEVDATVGPTLTPAQELEAAKKKITKLEAEVVGLKDQVKITADALEVERRRNFADGSIRAAWDLEWAELERRIALLTRERDHAVRVYEERHRALEADLAERMRSVTPEELTPERLRSTWELLQRHDASVHSLAGIATATHDLVTKKYRNRRYDPVQLEGADLKMVVMRCNKAMWPPSMREAWNSVNDGNDLSAIRHFFPGWAPLREADGGTIGLSPIWHRAQCQVCQNYFGPDGGYLPGYQFLAEKLIVGAVARTGTVFYEAGREPFSWERDEERRRDLIVPFLKGAIIAALELLHFYLCPSLASPGTYAEYAVKLYPLVRRNWPPECFNWSEKFIPGLQQLESGMATPGQAHRHAPSPHVVLSNDDEDE